MKKLLSIIAILAIFALIPALSFAQAPRDVDVSVAFDAPPAGENISNYQCSYSLKENGAGGASVNCDFLITSPLVPHVISLIATTADTIDVHIAACNDNPCSSVTSTLSVVLPPASDPATAPSGVVVTATKI